MSERGMQTVAEVVDRLGRSGWEDQFRVVGGALVASRAWCTHAPEDVRVDAQERFEGTTDPGDEALVLALTCRHGVRGTWTLTYGPGMDGGDADFAGRLGRPEVVAGARPA